MPRTVLVVADQETRLLSDRFQPDQWRGVDLVLSCGDLPPYYLQFLLSRLDVPVLYVRGNHDDLYEAEQYAGCENVHGRIVKRAGLRIAGFEGCHRYKGGPYQYTEREMRRIVWWSRLRSLRTGPPDIVLSHAPPAGIHDREDLCHRGFACFRAAIDAWQPALWLHGHVHAYESEGTSTIVGPTTVRNVFPYTVIEVPEVRTHEPADSGAA